MRLVKPLLVAGLACSLLAGCASSNNDKNMDNNNKPSPVRYDRSSNSYNENIDRVKYNDTDYDMNNNVNKDGRVSVSEKAANRVENLKGIDNAYVLATENNAYVAVKLTDKGSKHLSKSLEKKISDTVKNTDKSIDKVYVSINPDFFDRMSGYAKDLKSGHPISGLYDEFSTTIKRVFPDNK